MNILISTETYLPYVTGVSVSTDNIARYLASRGHKVTLVCPKPIAKGTVKPAKNLTIIHAPALPFSIYNLNSTAIFPLVFPLINGLMKNGKFDIVHIQEPGSLGLAVQIMAKKYKIPTLGALHFIPQQIDRVMWGSLEPVLTPFFNLIIKPIYNNYSEAMAPSKYFADYLKSIGVINKINIVSNGVDTKLFSPKKPNLKIRSEMGFTKDDVVFFFLGRLDRDKNVETIIRALPTTNKNVKIIIVGRGTEIGFLKSLAKKLDVESKIKWIPYISDDQMVSIYSAADVFCIMSPYEGQSIVTLQAVASGLPIVAANAGALPEIVEDNVNGYLVSTYNHSKLSEKINKLAESKGLRIKFGLESRKISLKHERSKVFVNLTEIYKKLISVR